MAALKFPKLVKIVAKQVQKLNPDLTFDLDIMLKTSSVFYDRIFTHSKNVY